VIHVWKKERNTD